MEPQQFPLCTYCSKNTSFMFVKSNEGQYNPGTGNVEFKLRAMCSDCMMKMWDSVMNPKVEGVSVITMMDVEGLIDQRLEQLRASMGGS